MTEQKKTSRVQAAGRAADELAQLWGADEPEAAARPLEKNEAESGVKKKSAPQNARELTPALARAAWEKERFEALRGAPGAMALHEEALARACEEGMLERLAEKNGLKTADVRTLWREFRLLHEQSVVAQARGARQETVADERQAMPQARKQAPAASETPDENEDSVRNADALWPPREEAPLSGEQMRRRRQSIGREIAEREEQACRLACEKLAAEPRRGSKLMKEVFRFVVLFGLGLALAGLGLFVRDAFRGAPAPAVADKTAAREALLELAADESLQTVMAAGESFERLFAEAAARVAARGNLFIVEASAVVAVSGAETGDVTEEIRREIVRMVRSGFLTEGGETTRALKEAP